MESAYFSHTAVGFKEADGYAAELRAIADVVVPEESNIIPEGDLVEQAYRQDERFRIRQRLLDEATRAERGAV
jgi:hypothetical protein